MLPTELTDLRFRPDFFPLGGGGGCSGAGSFSSTRSEGGLGCQKHSFMYIHCIRFFFWGGGGNASIPLTLFCLPLAGVPFFLSPPAVNMLSGAKSSVAAGFLATLESAEEAELRRTLLLLLVLAAGESMSSLAVRAVSAFTSTAAAAGGMALTRLPRLRSLSLKADTGRNCVSAAYADWRWAENRAGGAGQSKMCKGTARSSFLPG